jgi:hypothetical protein
LALEFERTSGLQSTKQEHNTSATEARFKGLFKLSMAAASMFVLVCTGVAWYDNYQRSNRELDIVPPPPAAISGVELFDGDKAKAAAFKNAQTLTLHSLN